MTLGCSQWRLPLLLNATCDFSLLFGANTLWNRVSLTRGFGTSATNLAMKSSGYGQYAGKSMVLQYGARTEKAPQSGA